MASKRKSIAKSIRFEVFKRDGFRCQYCGSSAPEVVLQIDHIIPVAEGGTNEIINLITSCVDCNSGKSSKMLSDAMILQKQRAQLDVLGERREQIEMMAQWYEEIRNQDEYMIDAVERAMADTGKLFSSYGRREIIKLINECSFEVVLMATVKSMQQYHDCNDDASSKSVFDGVFRIAKTMKRQKNDPFLHCKNKIRYILRNDLVDIDEALLRDILRRVCISEEACEELIHLAKEATSWRWFVWQVKEIWDIN